MVLQVRGEWENKNANQENTLGSIFRAFSRKAAEPQGLQRKVLYLFVFNNLRDFASLRELKLQPISEGFKISYLFVCFVGKNTEYPKRNVEYRSFLTSIFDIPYYLFDIHLYLLL